MCTKNQVTDNRAAKHSVRTPGSTCARTCISEKRFRLTRDSWAGQIIRMTWKLPTGQLFMQKMSESHALLSADTGIAISARCTVKSTNLRISGVTTMATATVCSQKDRVARTSHPQRRTKLRRTPSFAILRPNMRMNLGIYRRKRHPHQSTQKGDKPSRITKN